MKYRHTTNTKKITALLKKAYPGTRTSLRYDTPFDLLVATILSAQCTDKMVNKITPHLFKKYKNAKAFAKADIRALRSDIRSIGLYKAKAGNIRNMARRLVGEYNGMVPDSIEELVTLPGVGRKTANIVLSNAFNKHQGVAVDTHVKRISKRLGLTASDQPVKIERDLMKVLPKRDWGRFNHLLVVHGRAVCRARNPLHSECIIKKYCNWYKENT